MFLLADGRTLYTGWHTFGDPQPGTGSFLYDWRTKNIGDIPGLRDVWLRDQAGSVLLPPAQNQTFMDRWRWAPPTTAVRRTRSTRWT